jgi:nucleoside-diphosphate-sugar epimerase
MRIAITGATGFLGRYLVQRLASGGHRLRCWFRPESDRSGFDAVGNAIEWLPGQLGDTSATNALIQGVDAVVHAALEWQGTGFRASGHDDFLGFLEANLMGSLRLFHGAHRAGASRFVFISSCAVHEVVLGDRPLDESHPLWATSHFGAHKAALEKFVHSYGLGQGWPICAPAAHWHLWPGPPR